MLPASLRKDKTEELYQSDKLLGLTKQSLLESEVIEPFKHWVIVDNAYPYDMAFETCHLLLPRREVAKRSDLTLAEFEELQDILEHYVEQLYDTVMENTSRRRSILNHYHLHLMSYHQEREAFVR
jgi:diadenosine tetraphosphate (Ap4A) HIT family hydrolase